MAGKFNQSEYMKEYRKSNEDKILLKSCPFCGGKAEYYYEPMGRDNHFMGESSIYCKKCGDGFNSSNLSEKELTELWNRREI